MIYVLGSGSNAKISHEYGFWRVNFPVGSSCTLTNGPRTYKAPDDAVSIGRYTFPIPESGSWTVRCTDGTDTASKTISFSDKYIYYVTTLAYELVLFDYGDKTSVTGGWNTSALRFKQVSGQAGGVKPTVTTNSDGSITLGGLSGGTSGSHITVNKINLAGYSTVKFIGSVTSDDSAMPARSGFAASKNLTEFLQANAAASMNFPASASKTYSGTESLLDISSLTDSYYLLFGVYNTTKITIKKLWLE